jgi:hypothetical protein
MSVKRSATLSTALVALAILIFAPGVDEARDRHRHVVAEVEVAHHHEHLGPHHHAELHRHGAGEHGGGLAESVETHRHGPAEHHHPEPVEPDRRELAGFHRHEAGEPHRPEPVESHRHEPVEPGDESEPDCSFVGAGSGGTAEIAEGASDTVRLAVGDAPASPEADRTSRSHLATPARAPPA